MLDYRESLASHVWDAQMFKMILLNGLAIR